MKTIFFFILMSAATLFAAAQSKGTVKLYGYGQWVSRGKAPEIDENTGLRTSAGAGRNYFLYATSVTRIYPTEIWIEGTRYGVSLNSIGTTPVEYSDETNIGAPKKLLVPKTTRKVIQLVPTKVTVGKGKSAKALTLAKSNAVVLVYKQGGKTYYTTLASLNDLETAAGQ